MTEFFGDYGFYIFVAIALIAGIIIIRMVAGCIVRIVITLVLIAILGGGYLYFFEPEIFEEVTEKGMPKMDNIKEKGEEFLDKAKDKSEPLIEEAIEKAADHI